MRKRRMFGSLIVLGALFASLFVVTPVAAATDCTFTTSGTTMTLDADCTTDETILIPDGMTLDGKGNTITAVDPDGGNFIGPIVKNQGSIANVINLVVTADDLANACKAGDNRLRGIMFQGASGSITKSTVTGVNMGASGCQEGNAIEISNAPFDGTGSNTQIVEVAHNTVTDYQKSGIVANGDVNVSIHHNKVGASATQANLAPNSIQVALGASGAVVHNHVEGNQWLGTSNWAATAVLVYLAGEGLEVSNNNIKGSFGVGIYLIGSGLVVNNNRVNNDGGEGPTATWGIINCGDAFCNSFGDNVIKNNKVRGFDYPYYGVEGGKNKVIAPGPQKSEPSF
jgi:hypothetical protein